MGKQPKNRTKGARNHYLPVLYLKGFTRPDGKLTVVDRVTGESEPKGPRAAFFQRGFYPPGDEADFAQFEGEVTPVLHDILATATLPARGSDAYELLMNFVALQAMRGPRARRRLDALRRGYKELAGHGRELYAALSPVPPSEETEAKWKEMERPPTNEDHVAALRDAMEGILQPLADRNWTLLRAGDGALFVTSDQPVFLLWSDATGPRATRGPGFCHLGTELTFPLSADLLLFGSFEAVLPSGTTLNRRGVARMNWRALTSAVRYAGSKTEELVFALPDSGILGIDDLADLWLHTPVSPEEDLEAEKDAAVDSETPEDPEPDE